MSDILIYVPMPPYLRQWFIHRHGGCVPVTLAKNSIESKLLERATVKWPEDTPPTKLQPGEVPIVLPYFRHHDPRIYNFLTEKGRAALLSLLKADFDLSLWHFLHDFDKIAIQQKDLIYLFMEQHGIEEDGSCWDAIAKIYQRLRKSYQTAQRRKSKKSHST